MLTREEQEQIRNGERAQQYKDRQKELKEAEDIYPMFHGNPMAADVVREFGEFLARNTPIWKQRFEDIEARLKALEE